MQNAPNIIQDDDGCNVWKKAVKVFNERNSILLLFSRGIDIREEKRNIVTADYAPRAAVLMVPIDQVDGVFKLAVTLLDDQISDQPRL